MKQRQKLEIESQIITKKGIHLKKVNQVKVLT